MSVHNPVNLEADAQNRLRALELSSFIVEAPAGAGKTELLTQRYLKLLQTVNSPEEIIAITFTNKAAAEMRLRILDSLIKAANQQKPLEQHKQITYDLSIKALQHGQSKGWQLIDNPSRLRIFTIDSLCAHLARQMPLMSRFGAQPRVTEDASALYAQAAEQAIALLENVEHSEVLKTALRYVDNDANKLKSLLIKMLEKRDQWLGYVQKHAQHEIDAQALTATLSYLVEQELAEVAEVFSISVQHDLMPLARFAAGNLPCEHSVSLLRDWDTPLLTHVHALPTWHAVTDLLLTNDKALRVKIDKNIGFPADCKDEKGRFKALLETLDNIPGFAEILAKTKQLPVVSSAESGWEIITILSKLLNLAVAELWLVFQRAGEVDFVEIAQRATHALTDHFGEPTELALKLDYRIQHLLVDEFQDTSPSQIALLEQLMMGWQAGDGRTLFAVGDPMQSIYRFRKANVGLFIEAASQGIGDVQLERLQLYRNNRSCPALVDWINNTFASVFPFDDEMVQGAIHYRPFIATKQALPQAGVEVHPVTSQPDESSEISRRREAEIAVGIIQAERNLNPNKKIAVLVRSKKHLTPLVSLLRRKHQDIAFQAVEIEALEGRQIVQDLLSLTHALHHRADRVHWLAVLRAPWCGLTLHDLHALAGYDHRSTIWTLMQNEEVVHRLSADGQARLMHVHEILLEAFASQGRMNVSRWVRGIWLMLNGTACLWEKSDVIDVQAFFTCLDKLDRSNQFSPERMEMEITKLFATPDSRGEHLQMMTIHKSKGLEFDTVILLGLGATTGGNNADKPLVLWEEVTLEHRRELLAVPFIPKGSRDKDKISAYDYLESREKVRDTNETARVLYVAATRAERKLHLVGIANQNVKGEVKPTANTYLDMLWPSVSEAFQAVQTGEVCLEVRDEISSFTPQLLRLKRSAIPEILQTDQAVMAVHNQQNINPSLNHRLETDIGTLAHRYMEIIAQQGVASWPIGRVSALKNVMQHWFGQQGHVLSIAKEGAQNVADMLMRTLDSEDGQWILKDRAISGAELAMTKIIGQEIKNYIVDRTFVEAGVRWIIDYKTTGITDNASFDMFISAAEVYRKQLEDYATLFADEGLEVKCAIFFMSAAKLVQLQVQTEAT